MSQTLTVQCYSRQSFHSAASDLVLERSEIASTVVSKKTRCRWNRNILHFKGTIGFRKNPDVDGPVILDLDSCSGAYTDDAFGPVI